MLGWRRTHGEVGDADFTSHCTISSISMVVPMRNDRSHMDLLISHRKTPMYLQGYNPSLMIYGLASSFPLPSSRFRKDMKPSRIRLHMHGLLFGLIDTSEVMPEPNMVGTATKDQIDCG
ncbi:hypothetical protein KSP40_PGU018816 [Platanthera guangdongensis]|uniref:Uncharacterized protein n=1 Tax=Platanthera guangdongensis TaxID=2320717 RepID=A0ABR2MMQ9_9ASPA